VVRRLPTAAATTANPRAGHLQQHSGAHIDSFSWPSQLIVQLRPRTLHFSAIICTVHTIPCRGALPVHTWCLSVVDTANS
jgi:hypothetical protein